MTRILILGATGLLGHKLWQRLPAQFPETFAAVRRSSDALGKFAMFSGNRVVEGIDALDFSNIEHVLNDIQPSVVVNTIGVTKRKESATDPVASIELNALLPHRLVRWAARNNARVINFGTDCVFSGRLGHYTEDSLTDAEDLYGRTKALGEIRGEHGLTIRSSFIGRELGGRTELLEWALANRGRTIRGFRRAMYSGVSTIFLTRVVGDIIERLPGMCGLYQLAGDTISKYDLIAMVNEVFRADISLVPDDSVGIDRTLDGTRFAKVTGLRVPPWRDLLTELAIDPTPYDSWSCDAA
jgi:dTDP-4-dehydrorhamnose reductase